MSGKPCAGILFRNPEGKHLFVRRAKKSAHGGTWGIPGGTGEDGETPWRTARRETLEETGHLVHDAHHLVDHTEDGKIAFTTFGQDVQQFDPVLNDEHTAHVWATPDEVPEPLHPGVAATLRKVGVARLTKSAPLSFAQIAERRVAAAARWRGHAASQAALSAAARASKLSAGPATPKEAVTAMRRWGRTFRTEHAAVLTGDMKEVLGSATGNQLSAPISDEAEQAARQKGIDYTIVHNHPFSTPLSATDASAMVAREAAKKQAAEWGDLFGADADAIAKTPNVQRIMAADPKGQISILERRGSAEDFSHHMQRALEIVHLMYGRAINAAERRSMSRALAGQQVDPRKEALDANLKFSERMDGVWRGMDARGQVGYRTTGRWGKPQEKAGRALAALATGATAKDVARWQAKAFKLQDNPDVVNSMAAKIREQGLFKRWMPQNPPLAKLFDASKHRRDHVGRFASSSVWRTGSKTAALPVEYTGSETKEHETGTYLSHKFVAQVPSGMSANRHARLLRNLGDVARQNRTPAIDKAMSQGLMVNAGVGPDGVTKLPKVLWKVPEGTSRGAMNRAYTHAAKLALHDYGVADYDFKMDDHMKDEMAPLIPFIRYARRRIKTNMFQDDRTAGQWKPFREQFGIPFKDGRRDTRRGTGTGAVRLRTRPNEVLVKAAPSPLSLLAARWAGEWQD